jgi:type II secretory pathway pseudopilin PulG
MVVILLIGLLSALVAAVIWSQRDKASGSSALTSMKSAHTLALFCSNANSALNDPVVGTPNVTPICSDTTSVWPGLARGWAYTNPTQTNPSNFLFTATNAGQTKQITCDIDGCKMSDVLPPAPPPPGPQL